MLESSEIQNNPDVVFVGAGPVGLWVAIQAKLRDPKLEIVLHEKYQEYQRSHVLKIDKNSFVGTPHTEDGRKFKAIIDKFPRFVKTNVVEANFKKIAEDLGIKIIYEKVESCEDLAVQYPKNTVFVGSDGSHSLVGQQIFGGKKQVEEDLQYIAEIKYFVENTTTKLNLVLEGIPVMSYSKFIVSEHVGKERDGKTPVTVRFFLNKKTFEELRGQDGTGAKFNNPYRYKNLDDGSIPKDLAESMKAWIRWRKILRREKCIKFEDDQEFGEKITAINLAVYASEKFVKEVNGQHWVLVGDAAMGVPYFRALNAGLLCGTQLANALCEHFNPQNISRQVKFSPDVKADQTALESYACKVQRRVDTEIARARVKDTAVNTGRFFVNTSVADVHFSRFKLPMQKEQVDNDIVDLMTWYLLENYNDENDLKKYREISEYYICSYKLERIREFPDMLNQAYEAAKMNFSSCCDKGKLNAVTNLLKASIYQEALDKQNDLRKSRIKTTKVMSLWGLLLPVISHVIILVWYLYRLWKEPLRSKKITPYVFKKIYTEKKEAYSGLSQSELLDSLNRDKQPVRYKNGELRAHRALIAINDPRLQEQSESTTSNGSNPLLSETYRDTFSAIQVISTKWNRQARIFDRTIKDAIEECEHDKESLTY